jgi:hypothetical protein
MFALVDPSKNGSDRRRGRRGRTLRHSRAPGRTLPLRNFFFLGVTPRIQKEHRFVHSAVDHGHVLLFQPERFEHGADPRRRSGIFPEQEHAGFKPAEAIGRVQRFVSTPERLNQLDQAGRSLIRQAADIDPGGLANGKELFVLVEDRYEPLEKRMDIHGG